MFVTHYRLFTLVREGLRTYKGGPKFVSSFFISVSGKVERLIGQKSVPEDVSNNDSGRDKRDR